MKPTGATKDDRLSVRQFDFHKYGDITVNETSDGITVAIAYMQGRGPEVKQRAEEIVTAVNERERLREVLLQVRAASNHRSLEMVGSLVIGLIPLIDAALSDATPSASADGG